MAQDFIRTETQAPLVPALGQPAGADLRGAPRFALMVRTAKLVADGREYLCVLRDVSATGCKVRLFHPLPAHGAMALETGSGERYPMEMKWCRDDHAGFHFYEDVDIQRLVEDNRGQFPKRQIRLRIDRDATIHANGRAIAVQLRDISQQGACIECPERLMLRQTVRVETPGFPPIYAKVCWRQVPRHGLVFDKGFLLEELAQNMMKLHEAGGNAVGGRLRAAT